MSEAAWVEVPFEVQKPQDGLRVDAYLAARLHRYSRSQVQRLIEEGKVLLRGRAVKASSRVTDGDKVIIRYPRRLEEPARHESLDVLYEDSDLLAVNKPGDILSHPTDKVVENSATSILKKQFQKLKLHLAHRLDRETSGVLLFAKNSEAARRLASQFAGRAVEKEYLAIVRGRFAWAEKTVDVPIGREELEIKVRQKVGSGQPAVTVFRRERANDSFSLVRALPKTGRLHQIRVHLAWLGHPIVGDKLYTGGGEYYMKAVRKEIGGDDFAELGAPRQMLHAERLRLEHPMTGKGLEVVSPVVGDFRSCLEASSLPITQELLDSVTERYVTAKGA